MTKMANLTACQMLRLISLDKCNFHLVKPNLTGKLRLVYGAFKSPAPLIIPIVLLVELS